MPHEFPKSQYEISGDHFLARLATMRCVVGRTDVERPSGVANILTFNPGWDQNAQTLDSFTDVRDLQRELKAQGLTIVNEADESTTGPASFIVIDPDGNPILIDQPV